MPRVSTIQRANYPNASFFDLLDTTLSAALSLRPAILREQLNYTNIAHETGVSAATVRNYFQILEDTLLGFTLEPWHGRSNCRLVETAKFYLFDVGVANQLHLESARIAAGSDRFGRAFDHLIINAVRAYLAYSQRDVPVRFWRTSSGFEVDLVLGDMDVAIACKSGMDVRHADLRGLRALADDHATRRRLVVSRVETPRLTDDAIEIVNWRNFCTRLWSGEII